MKHAWLVLTFAPLLAAQAQPADLAATLAEARTAFDAGDTYEAETLYREILAQRPADAEALIAVGRICRLQQRRDEALELLERGVRADPTHGHGHLFLGLALSEKDARRNRDRALAHLSRGIELLPPGSRAQGHDLRRHGAMRLGQLAAAGARYDAARQAYEQARAMSAPEDLAPLRRLIDLALRAGRPDAAQPLLDELLKVHPEDAEARTQLTALLTPQEADRLLLSAERTVLGVGEVLPGSAIWASAENADGWTVRFARHWEASAGLELLPGDPPSIRARDQPSAEETLYLVDELSGNTAQLRFAVRGPAVALELAPAVAVRAPGERLTAEAVGRDAVGNSVPVSASWALRQGETERALSPGVDGALTVPADAAPGTYELVARSGSLSATGRLELSAFGAIAGEQRWHLEEDAARAAAAADERPLLVLAWSRREPLADPVPPAVLSGPAVAPQLAAFVCARFELRQAELLDHPDIPAEPALLVFSPTGALVLRQAEPLEGEALGEALAGALQRSKALEARLQPLRAAAELDASAGAAQLALAQAYLDARMYSRAREAYRQALMCRIPAALAAQTRLTVVRLEHQSHQYDEMEVLVDSVLSARPGPDVRAQAMVYKALCLYDGRGRFGEARAAWEELVRRLPRSPWARRARVQLEDLFR